MESLVDIVGVMHDPKIAKMIMESLADAKKGFYSTFVLSTDKDYKSVTVHDRIVGNYREWGDIGHGFNIPFDNQYLIAFRFKPQDSSKPLFPDANEFFYTKRMQMENVQESINHRWNWPEDSKFYIPTHGEAKIEYCNPIYVLGTTAYGRTADLMLLQRTVDEQKDLHGFRKAIESNAQRPNKFNPRRSNGVTGLLDLYKNHMQVAQAIRSSRKYFAIAGAINNGELQFENFDVQRMMEPVQELNLKRWYGLNEEAIRKRVRKEWRSEYIDERLM